VLLARCFKAKCSESTIMSDQKVGSIVLTSRLRDHLNEPVLSDRPTRLPCFLRTLFFDRNRVIPTLIGIGPGDPRNGDKSAMIGAAEDMVQICEIA
jgi:hypothetical protein